MTGRSKENVHMPRYIKEQPWYYKEAADTENDYLLHHRQTKKGALDIDNNAEPKLGPGIYDRFETVQMNEGEVRRKCSNCGSNGHLKKDCLERPRKILKAYKKEVLVKRKASLEMDWDAKQDRWFGYNGEEYDKILRDWKIPFKATPKNLSEEPEWDTDEEIELIKLGLYNDPIGDLRQDDSEKRKLKASVRLREDTAAYLNDLDSEELKYDPKSRVYKSKELGFIDNDSRMFHRHLTGEARELQDLTRFSRIHAKRMGVKDDEENEAKAKHVLVANPTQYEIMRRQDRDKAESNHRKKKKQAQRIKGTTINRKELEDLYG